MRIFDELDDHGRRYFTLAGLAYLRALTGDPHGALEWISPTLPDAGGRQQVLARGWLLWARVVIEHMCHPPEESLPALEQLDESLPTRQGGLWMWNAAWCEAIRAERHADAGDLARAREALSRAREILPHPLAGRALPRVRLAEARVLAAAGDTVAAERVAREVLHLTATASNRLQVIEALELLGILRAERGYSREGVRLLGAADRARVDLGSPCPPNEAPGPARTLERLRSDQPAAVEDAWQQGRTMALQEAVAYAERDRGTREQGEVGAATLTRAERQVARLAATGLSNAEIAAALVISIPTVKTHLNRSFHKLGLHTRAELASMGAELD